jgi:predicted RNase H-like HicB family nuclease
MSAKKVYRVTVEREPGFWIIRIPELDQVVTQARRLADVKQNAREAIAVWLDEPIAKIDVQVDVKLPDSLQATLEDARRLQQEAAERTEQASRASSEVARVLTKELGMTLREAGEVLDLSFQRVAQLVERGLKNGERSHRRRGPRVEA